MHNMGTKEVCVSLILGGDFNIPLNPTVDTSSGKTCITYRVLKKLKTLLQSLQLVDSWRFLHPEGRDFTFFPHPTQSLFTHRLPFYYPEWLTSSVRILHRDPINFRPCPHFPESWLDYHCPQVPYLEIKLLFANRPHTTFQNIRNTYRLFQTQWNPRHGPTDDLGST